MDGRMSFDALAASVDAGGVDTVLSCVIDMQGRLMGKRFHARHFVDGAWEASHCCNHLLATDLEMSTVPGFAAVNWDKGYGDYLVRPDLGTLRRIPWLDGSVLVLCDLVDPATGLEVAHSPRAMLRRQIARMEALGLQPMMASELEFYLFAQSAQTLRAGGFRDMAALSSYAEDYSILQTSPDEPLMRAIRNGLFGAGIPIESSKGEADAGQQELNIRYGDALEAADNHTLVKHACKEIARTQGRGLTFLAKWHHERSGSSAHIHQSLWTPRGAPAFFDPDSAHGMSDLMRHYLAGLLAHTREITYFLAPYVNSYKRLRKGYFAPVRNLWSVDNRSVAFRLCGAGTRDIRVECRIGGADLNPYLAMAALLAAGIDGIERKLDLPPPFTGNAYDDLPGHEMLPATLGEAIAVLERSDFARAAFGEAAVAHYLRAARWELEEHDRVVTDWELTRGFERA